MALLRACLAQLRALPIDNPLPEAEASACEGHIADLSGIRWTGREVRLYAPTSPWPLRSGPSRSAVGNALEPAQTCKNS